MIGNKLTGGFEAERNGGQVLRAPDLRTDRELGVSHQNSTRGGRVAPDATNKKGGGATPTLAGVFN
jgi:hypothetical protein